MLYTELKTKLQSYLDSDLPKTLFWSGGFSNDVTKTIKLSINRIDNATNLKKKGVHHSDKNNLLKILKAIDNGQFDISNCKEAYFAKK